MSKLHFDHSVLVADLQNAQQELWDACDNDSPVYVVTRKAANVERTAEKLADLDNRMQKIWGSK